MIDLRPILAVLGLLLIDLAAAMLIPMVVDLGAGNADWEFFAVSALTVFFLGGSLTFAFRTNVGALDVRQAFLLTVLAWLFVSAASALPFILSHHVPSYTDALFETISGLTTTGSTVLSGLDRLPPGILVWRALLQWLGGIGIVAMAIMILPLLRVGGMQLFRMESSERSERVVPRAMQLVAAIALVYLALTAACATAYRLAGMSTFDATLHAMTTLSTGGFSTHDASFAFFHSDAMLWIATVFMIAGSLPFVLYVRTLRGELLALVRTSQSRRFVIFLTVVIGLLSLWYTASSATSWSEALTHVTFNMVSIVTTTGYVSQNYAAWGPLAATAALVLTFVGGCTGSTAGGLKMFRFEIMLGSAKRMLQSLIEPHAVFRRNYDGRPLDEDVPASVLVFVFLYLATITVIAIGLGACGLEPIEALSGAATAVANVGPALGDIIGPVGNFSSLSDPAKWLLSAGMLLGRLELMTVYVLFVPLFWRH